MNQPASTLPDKPAAGRKADVRRLSLRVLLSAAMVGLIIVVTVALIGLAYYRARVTALATVQQRMDSFSDRLVSRLVILSSDTSTLVSMIASVANSFLAPPSERLDDKMAALRGVLERSPHMDGVYAGYPDGSFFHAANLADAAWRQVLRAPDDAVLAIRAIERDRGGRIAAHIIFFDAAGRRLPKDRFESTSFDPRQRPWYIAAVRGKDPVATGPYRMAATGALGMTISQAHKGNPTIVIGADVMLTEVTAFLAQERLSPNSVAFITDPHGRLIVHSDALMMSRIMTALSERDFDPSWSPDILTEQLRGFSEKDDTPVIVEAGGRKYMVMAMTIRTGALFSGARIFVAAPFDELMAPANRAVQQGLAIAAVVVAAGVLSALVLAQLISRPLQELTRGANRLHDLDFHVPIGVNSRVREIATLSDALNRAADAMLDFALYVPREVVRALIQSGEVTAAARQDVTALFTDIYDFTTISEQHSPEEVTRMLSDYFDILNHVVTAHNGTIIQFLGDSIFAMWNAPAPNPHHAEDGCRGALAMKAALADFNADQRRKGLPEFRTRFGLHSGPAVVGSVGAADRLQYTAMGDTINVASRLEGMNKQYGTIILASGSVFEKCKDRIEFRPLGEGSAKGRGERIGLYEVLHARSRGSEVVTLD